MLVYGLNCFVATTVAAAAAATATDVVLFCIRIVCTRNGDVTKLLTVDCLMYEKHAVYRSSTLFV